LSRLKILFFRKRERQVVMDVVEYPLKSEPLLSKEEMRQGIIILSCKVCNASTKHKVEGNRVQNHQLRLPVRRGGQIWYSHNPATCLICGSTYIMYRRKN